MQRSSWTVVTSLLVVFVSGILVGVFGHQFYTLKTVNASVNRPPEALRKTYVEKLQTRLHLTPDQVGKLEAILDHTHDQYHDYRERHRDELRAMRDEQIKSVHEILSNQQDAEYDKVIAEQDHDEQVREQQHQKDYHHH